MAEIKLTNVEIHNKYAEASHWDQYANSIPAKGDFISFEVSLSNGEKIVLLKQGDGKTSLKDLPIISGLSADVSDWAKQVLPDSEISDVSTNAVQNKVVKTYVDTSVSTQLDNVFSIVEEADSWVMRA